LGLGGLVKHLATRCAFALFLMAALCFGSIRSSSAEDNEEEAKCPDKSQYTLFNPTPADCMREFDPDRPDVTDSPFTIDAGHIEFETGLFSYDLSRPDHEGGSVRSSTLEGRILGLELPTTRK
jgi:hypothetical protein